jgi:riboflavin kinase
LNTIELDGTIVTGKGEGRKFLELTWVVTQIEEKLGFKPFPGTLNLKLTKSSTRRRKLLSDSKTLQIVPSPGYREGLLFQAWVEGLECGIVLPQVEDYPDDVLEVIAPLNLRKRFQLIDGRQIKVVVGT